MNRGLSHPSYGGNVASIGGAAARALEPAFGTNDELRGRIRGALLRPAQTRTRRDPFGPERDDRPASGADRPGSRVTDAVARVNAARTHGFPLSIEGGGHNIARLAVCEGA